MPFFLVHQPVIIAVAYFVVQWDAAILAKWAVIALGSLVASVTMATALARMPVVSRMFGVKSGPHAAAPSRGGLGACRPW